MYIQLLPMLPGILWQRLLASNLSGTSWYLSTDMEGDFNTWSNQYVWKVASAGTTTFSGSGYNGGACIGGTGNITAMHVPNAYGAISESAATASDQPTP